MKTAVERPKPKRSRLSKFDPTEDLTAELFNSPVMKGLISFLNVRPSTSTVDTDGPTHIPPQSQSTVDKERPSATPQGSPPTVDEDRRALGDHEFDSIVQCKSYLAGHIVPPITTPDPTVDKYSESTVEPVETPAGQYTSSTVDVESVVAAFNPVVRRYKFVPRPLQKAQDGHSPGEQSLYEKMWQLAPPIPAETRFRLLTCGYSDLAQALRCDKKQVRRWLEELTAKLAIEIATPPGYRSKTTYRIYSWQALIHRRKAAGFVAFVKNRGGVTLIKSGSTADTDSTTTLDFKTTEDTDSLSTVSTETAGGGGTVSTGGVDKDSRTCVDTESPINKQEVYKTSSSSSDIAELTTGLRQILGDVDDGFIRKLLDECREVQLDCTVSEILHFTSIKAKYRGARSLTGFLLKSVPPCLAGESFRQFREAQQAAEAASRAQLREEKEAAEQILADRQGREAWEVEHATGTVEFLKTYHPWLWGDVEAKTPSDR